MKRKTHKNNGEIIFRMKNRDYIFKDINQRRFYDEYYRDTYAIDIVQPSGQKLTMMGMITEQQCLDNTEYYRPKGSKYVIRKTTLKDFFDHENTK